ncbi:MAG: carboxypeptidase regulatory-like domain-containing protein [Planctomycetota bacterium]|nr:carboxypeptidase regulatory-like domain-containing protein [Planctomycetota bacterium]
MKSMSLPLAVVFGALAALSLGSAQAADGYGTFSGQVVLDGEMPQLKPKVEIGSNAKDKQCCAVKDVLNDEMVVNKENKGVQNVFVFLKSKVAASDIHPDLKKSKEAKVVFDQKTCQFTPHALIVRLDQQVVVKSGDNISHNTHSYSIFNPGQNFIVGPNDRVGVEMPKFNLQERLPIEVKCDIHSWMRAWWLIVDHPYAVITDKDGKFKIENLPVGTHTFTIWHERVGYIEKTLDVKIEAGKTATAGKDGVVTFNVSQFEIKDDEKAAK